MIEYREWIRNLLYDIYFRISDFLKQKIKKMKLTKYIIIVLAVTLLATACKVGPNYKQPDVIVAEQFRFSANEDSIQNIEWWTMFNDPDLDTLVNYALDSSLDVLAMAKRVEQARYNVGYTKSDIWPTFGVQAGVSSGNFSGTRLPSQSNAFSAGVNLSWELDFWGKFRRLTESAKADYLATEYGMRELQVSVITEVSKTYFILLDYKARQKVAEKTLESRNEYLDIIQQKFDAGLVPEIDLNQAQMQKAIAESAIPLYKRYVAKTEHALSILIGKNPGEIKASKDLLEAVIPESIPNGLPSQLLSRRPDILKSEMLLRAQNAKIGAAVAMRFPSISLSGFMGGASNDLSSFTTEGLAWNAGTNLLGPLFQFGKNKRRVEIERAKTEEKLFEYDKTILNAFREVEDALVDIETYNEEIVSRKAHFKAADNAQKLSQLRYDKGVTSYLEVLESQRQAFEAELNLYKTKQEFLNSYILLYKAVGGGWISKEEQKESEK